MLALECLLVWWATAARYCHPPGWGEGCDLLKWLYDWQTLLAGCLAIVAALIGGYVVKAQTRQAAEYEQEHTRRRQAAARAVLPLSLSTICEYAEQCAAVLRQLHDSCSDESLPREAGAKAVFPAVPSAATAELKEMIEAADATTAATFAVVLSKIQVQAANLREFNALERSDEKNGHVIPKSSIEHYMLRTAEIYARTVTLFEFARAEVDTVSPEPPSEDEMSSALNLFRLFHPQYDPIYEGVPRYVEGLRRRGR